MQTSLFKPGNYNASSYLELLESGENYFDTMLSVIREAKKEIHLQSYSLESDETGKLVIAELINAAERGVKVYMLLDAYGSRLDKETLEECERHGIFCYLFSPFIYSKFRTGRRLHHKILLVDGETAIIGGINLADKYRGTKDHAAWLDFALLIKGPVCMDIRRRCVQLIRNRRIPLPEFETKKQERKYLTRFTQNDWFHKKTNIYKHLKQAIRFSEKEIIIVCSYFIPTFKLVNLLTAAARRGVKISLYLQGESDIPLARNASRFWYRAFFRNGISICEFPNRVMHAKLVIVDQKWLSIGSYNFNHVSDYTSIEANAEVLDVKFVAKVRNQILLLFRKHASSVNPDNYLHKQNFLTTFKWWASHKTATFLMQLLFAITSKETNH